MAEIDQELAARLRAARKDSKLSQGQLAAKIGLTSAQVSRIETGKRSPSTGALYRWFRACGIDLEAVEIGEESTTVEIVELVEAMTVEDLALGLLVLRAIPSLGRRERGALQALVAAPEP